MRSDRFKFNLPDDLSELAAQLTDDAHHLAARYPAAANPTLESPTRSAFWPRLAVAAVLLAMCGTAAAVSLHLWQLTRTPVDQHHQQSPVLATNSPAEKPAAVPNPAGVQEVGFNLAEPAGALDESQMLRIQLNAFEQVIQRLQHQLQQRERSDAETQTLIDSLRHEVQDLNRRLDEHDKSQSR